VTEVRPRLLYVITEDWYFWSHRLDLAKAARAAGFDVAIATRVTDHGERIRREGLRLIPIGLDRRSRNPMRECASILELINLYRREHPHIVHHVALKPILYGALAARWAEVPVVINAFAGLGYTYTDRHDRQNPLQQRSLNNVAWHVSITWCLKKAVRLNRSVVLCQNADDRDRLVERGIVRSGDIRIVAGSGVDTNTFRMTDPPQGYPIVLLPARTLWDKGIAEFVRAARLLQAKGIRAKFVLVGRCDDNNPAAIPQNQLHDWVREGTIEWWGHREDMTRVYAEATIVVLPSYREGLPKVLLEAAACGKALIATDVPGCREAVRHQVNGLLVPVRDAPALARAIEHLLVDGSTRERMGKAGRELVVREFALSRITGQMVALYRELLGTQGLGASSQGHA
jgi:glycosyltransferase involved in cell wall biosynthesis